jgi:ADP-ribosylation factor related protein 1
MVKLIARKKNFSIMLSLLFGFWDWLFRREELKLIIVGVDNAGKSTTLEQLRRQFTGKGMDLDKIPPTIGLNIARFQVNGVVAICWDVGGQLGLRQLWSNYFEEVDGIIFVADSSDKDRFHESSSALASALSNSSLTKKPLLFLANKQDKSESVSLDEIRQAFNLESISDRPVRILKCSARLNECLDEGIRWVVDEAVKYNKLKGSPLST